VLCAKRQKYAQIGIRHWEGRRGSAGKRA